MDNYRKNSVKLLPLISNENNKLIIYTEFDTFFDVEDYVYILVYDTFQPEYLLLDSVKNLTNYKVLNKSGNKITLDINYEEIYNILKSDILTSECVITRIIINDSKIIRATINSSVIKNTIMQPISSSSIDWKQGIVTDNIYEFENVNFKSKYDNTYLILTSEYNIKTKQIENYYTNNNKGLGLSVLNLSNDSLMNFINCDVYAGEFNNSIFYSANSSYVIKNGKFNNCVIGSRCTIDNGKFNNCTFSSNDVIWNYGVWNYEIDNTSDIFRPSVWNDGIWMNGKLSNTTSWSNGIFYNGLFNGVKWTNGEFNGGNFNKSTWINGQFNNGTMINSTWVDGIFNNGIISDSTWVDGTFNNGSVINSTWTNGIFNNGIINSNSIWWNGTFNNGQFDNSVWWDGEFNNGKILNNTKWWNGKFYNGSFQDSTWDNGKFYNGNMTSSSWSEGSVYYGILNAVKWDSGNFYNGTMNNSEYVDRIEWFNGISNNCIFGNSLSPIINWYNGSFNSGSFGTSNHVGELKWYNGSFYTGTFLGDYWFGGVFYIGDDNNKVVDSKYKINKPFEAYKM